MQKKSKGILFFACNANRSLITVQIPQVFLPAMMTSPDLCSNFRSKWKAEDVATSICSKLTVVEFNLFW